MNYANELKQIGALVKAVAAGARRLSWNLHRTTPDAIRRRAETRNEQLMAESEAYRRNRTEHPRVIGEITKEEKAACELAAAAARWHVEPKVRQLDQQYHDLIARCRRDTALSFPNCLDHFRPPDMLMLAQYRETRRASLESASVSVLLQTAQRAIANPDAAGFVDLQLIEERCARGAVSAESSDLPAAKELHLFIAEQQELRIPFSLDESKDIEETIVFGRKSISMADLIQIRPINVEQPGNIAAKQAFEAEANEYAEAVEAAAEAAEAAAGQ